MTDKGIRHAGICALPSATVLSGGARHRSPLAAGRGLPTAEVDDIIQAVTQADHVKLKEQRRKASPGASRADLINAIKPDPIAPQPKGSHP